MTDYESKQLRASSNGPLQPDLARSAGRRSSASGKTRREIIGEILSIGANIGLAAPCVCGAATDILSGERQSFEPTAGYKPDEVVVKPPIASGPLDNPLKGWAINPKWAASKQPYSMVFLQVSWKELEPIEGDYECEQWEKRTWDLPAARGKHVVLRVFIDYPTLPSGIPDWILAKGVKTTKYTVQGGGTSPDYDDPILVRGLEKLIAALGRRYDQNPRLAFIQMGFLGFWGEWHCFPETKLFANTATQTRMFEAVHTAFPNKIVMARYPSFYAENQDWLGFFDDLFPTDTDGAEQWKLLPGLRRTGRIDNWKRGAIGGEMEPGQAIRWLGDGFEHMMKVLKDSHFSWVGPAGPAVEATQTSEFTKRSQEMVRQLGYEFALTEIRHSAKVRTGKDLMVTITGENSGVAPFYYPWPLELALLDKNDQLVERIPVAADIRAWLPGKFHVSTAPTFTAQRGKYALAIGIIDPWTNRPAIGFANDLPKKLGWTLVSMITVI